MSATTAASPKPRLGLSAQILIGLALGAATGLFFGEPIAVLQPLAEVYIHLVQMTVLPYLVITLIAALGGLDAARARLLARAGGVVLLATWLVTLVVIALLPLALPPLVNASFFSTALLAPQQPLVSVETYIPSNPFHALANAVVPAVVLFSCAVGIALIGLPRKRALLGALQTLEQAIVRVTHFAIATTPLGVFAIAAVAVGTVDLATVQRLEGYLLLFVIGSLLLAFVLLPLLVTAVTPLSYREVVGIAGDALLTAFAASSAFIVVPIVVERSRALLQRHGLADTRATSTIEVLVPLAFVFPNAGRLLTLLFVPYVAWLAGDPLGADRMAALFGAGVFAYFAKAQVALPFLLDLTGVPQDFFQLYIPTTILTGKFDSLLSAMALLVVGLLGAAVAGGFIRFDARRVLRALVLGLGVTLAAFAGSRLLLAATLDTAYRKNEALTGMHAPRGPLPAIVRSDPPPPDTGPGSAFDRIRARGVLRVGYVADRPPFAFQNRAGELVGMDIELAGLLARDLGVYRIEFVGTDWAGVPTLLDEQRIDVALSVPYLRDWLVRLRYAGPYLDGVMGFALPDGERHDFVNLDRLRRRGPLLLGLRNDDAVLQEALRGYLKGIEVGFSPVPAPREYFEGRRPELDALVMTAQEASAWSLLYPQYSVVVPHPEPLALPVGIAVRKGHGELAAFIDDWLVLQKSAGTIRHAYDYWVLGQGAQPPPRRWSVLRDVLGWQGGRKPKSTPAEAARK